MGEEYELFVVCRRVVRLGTGPRGIDCAELPIAGGRSLLAALPFAEAPVQLVRLQRQTGEATGIAALARACAEAGDGVALRYLPVTSPPRYAVEHDGRGGAPGDWAGVLARMAAYQQAERREAEAERERRAAARAAWTPDPRADWSDLAEPNPSPKSTSTRK